MNTTVQKYKNFGKLRNTKVLAGFFASSQKGFGVVEIVVSAAIITIVLLGLVAAFHGALKISTETGKKIQANFLAEEGMEAVRIMRDTDWNNIGRLSTTTSYRFAFTGSAWATSTAPALVGGVFDRTFIVRDVYRDGAGKIAASGAYDPETKKVTVTVGWLKAGATTTVSLATYFARIF